MYQCKISNSEKLKHDLAVCIANATRLLAYKYDNFKQDKNTNENKAAKPHLLYAFYLIYKLKELNALPTKTDFEKYSKIVHNVAETSHMQKDVNQDKEFYQHFLSDIDQYEDPLLLPQVDENNISQYERVVKARNSEKTLNLTSFEIKPSEEEQEAILKSIQSYLSFKKYLCELRDQFQKCFGETNVSAIRNIHHKLKTINDSSTLNECQVACEAIKKLANSESAGFFASLFGAKRNDQSRLYEDIVSTNFFDSAQIQLLIESLPSHARVMTDANVIAPSFS